MLKKIERDLVQTCKRVTFFKMTLSFVLGAVTCLHSHHVAKDSTLFYFKYIFDVDFLELFV